ncbi:MAG: FIST N-terminal domain-containing protein, partial [Gallionella sp.]
MKTEFQFVERLDEAMIDELLTRCREKNSAAGMLVLLPEDLRDMVPKLQRCAISTGVRLVGAIFPELIFGSEFRRDGILLIEFASMPDYILSASLNEEHGKKMAVQALSLMVEKLPKVSSLLMFFDGMLGNISSILDDIYYELGDRCHYVGLCAGSESFQPMPCVFDRDNLFENGLLGIGLPLHSGAVLNHSYNIPPETLTASATTNNRITQIDWRPAFEKYAELIQSTYGVTVTRENFYSMGVHFPFALHRISGEMLIRIPVAVDDEGALFCVGEVPEGALLNVAQAIPPGSTEAVSKLVA